MDMLTDNNHNVTSHDIVIKVETNLSEDTVDNNLVCTQTLPQHNVLNRSKLKPDDEVDERNKFNVAGNIIEIKVEHNLSEDIVDYNIVCRQNLKQLDTIDEMKTKYNGVVNVNISKLKDIDMEWQSATSELFVISDNKIKNYDVADQDMTNTEDTTDYDTERKSYPREKSFPCEVCQKTFSAKCTLTRHMGTHSGKKSFSCEVCLKTFTQKCHLASHMSTHSGEKPFSCPVCYKTFARKSCVTSHMSTHSGEKPYPCEMCHKTFSRNGLLLRHMRIHSGVKPYPCDACHKTFGTKATLRRHMRTHSREKTFPCKSSTEVDQRNKSNVSGHIVDGKVEHNLTKEMVGYNLVCRQTLRQHKAIDGMIPEYNVVNQDIAKPKDYDIEWRSATSQEFVIGDNKVEKDDVVTPDIINTDDTSDYDTECRSHPRKNKFVCEVCHKTFSAKFSLTRHIRTHLGEKSFSCDFCNKTFTQKCHLACHMNTHSGEKPFSCKVCYKKFATKSCVTTHMRTHSGEKPYSCEVCHKKFSTKGSLRRHMGTHSREMTFSCRSSTDVDHNKSNVYGHIVDGKVEHVSEDMVDYNLVCSQTLNQHDTTDGVIPEYNSVVYQDIAKLKDNDMECRSAKTQEFVIGDNKVENHAIVRPDIINTEDTPVYDTKCRSHPRKKTFVCEVCHKTFSGKFSLTRHIRTHSGEKSYSCDVCLKTFTQKCHLACHVNKHSGDKPFSCKICFKTFTTKSYVTTHMRTHSGEKPYSCDVCHKTFSAKGSLRRHMRTHSREIAFSCKSSTEVGQRNKSNVSGHIVDGKVEHNLSKDMVDYNLVCRQTLSQHDTVDEILPKYNSVVNQAIAKLKDYKTNDMECRSAATIEFVIDDNKVENDDVVNHNISNSEDTRDYGMECRSPTTDDCGKDDMKFRIIQEIITPEDFTNIELMCRSTLTRDTAFNTIKTEKLEEIYQNDASESANNDSVKRKDVFLGEDCSSDNIQMGPRPREKPFPCEVCHKTFNIKSTLTRHMITHSGARIFSCDICHKAFTQKCILRSHMGTHLGEKPFSCKLCYKTFTRKSCVINHMRIHSGEKPYPCKVCHRTFSRKSTVTRHMRTHSRKKTFSYKSSTKVDHINRSNVSGHIIDVKVEHNLSEDLDDYGNDMV